MAGSVRVLMVLAVLASAPAFAQTPPDPAQPAPTSPARKRWLPGGRKAGNDGTPSPEFDNVRKAMEALTPEQRKRFQENFARWANLSPEEKKALGGREEIRKKFMQQEVEAALREVGLRLEGERRAQFVKRYGEERRGIEDQLRQEIAEKRKPLVRELIARLKTEFADSASASESPVIPPAPLAAPH